MKGWLTEIDAAFAFRDLLRSRGFEVKDRIEVPLEGEGIIFGIEYRRPGESHWAHCYGPRDFDLQNGEIRLTEKSMNESMKRFLGNLSQ